MSEKDIRFPRKVLLFLKTEALVAFQEGPFPGNELVQ